MLATTSPLPMYFDRSGTPLDSGLLFFGEANENPVTRPVTVYWDAAATQPAAQPIRTLNGFPARNGTPAVVYVSGNYSLSVLDRRGQQVLYVRSSAEVGVFLQDGDGAVDSSVQDELRRNTVSWFHFMTEAQRNDVMSGAALTDVSSPLQKAWDAAYGDGTVVREVTGWGKARLSTKINLYSGFRGIGPYDNANGTVFVWVGAGATIFEADATLKQGTTFENFVVDGRNVTSDFLTFHFTRGLVSGVFRRVKGFAWHDGQPFTSCAFADQDFIKLDGDNGAGGKGDVSLNRFEDIRMSRFRRGIETTDPYNGAAGGESEFIGVFGLNKEWILRLTGRANKISGGDAGGVRTGFSAYRFTGPWAGGTHIDAVSVECETSGDTAILCDLDTSPIGAMGQITGGKCFTGSWVSDLGVGTKLNRWIRGGDEDGLASFDGRSAFVRGRSTMTDNFTVMGGVMGQGGLFTTVRGSSDAVSGMIALGNSSAAVTDPGGKSGVSAIIDAATTSNFRVLKTSDGIALTEVLRVDKDRYIGNTAAANTAMLDFKDTLASDTTLIAQLGGPTIPALKLYATEQVNSDIYNAANAAAKVTKNVTTGRSINAAGTLNAGGADYAEYERKRDDCATIEKGQVVGFDADGLLTDRWSLLVRPGIKSTNPSYVGGDTWSAEIGEAPAKPVQREAVVQYVETAPGENDEAYAARVSAWRADREERLAADERKLPERPQRVQPVVEQKTVKHGETNEEFAARLAAWGKEHTAWAVRLEAERVKVDRIAYSGKVPVNVTGAQPGDYIVAAEGGDDTIIGTPVSGPTFEQYRLAIGRVNRILDDGRAEVAVIVH